MNRDFNNQCPLCVRNIKPDADWITFPFDDIVAIAEHLKKTHLLKIKQDPNDCTKMACIYEKYKETAIIK